MDNKVLLTPAPIYFTTTKQFDYLTNPCFIAKMSALGYRPEAMGDKSRGVNPQF